MNGNIPSAPPGNFMYPRIGEYQPQQTLDENVNNFERKISSILGKYKFKNNTRNNYQEMFKKITELTNEFKQSNSIEDDKKDRELPKLNHHYANKYDDKNFEKFEQHFKMCQYYFSNGQKELFESIQIIKSRKNELKDMRCIPANMTRKVYDEIKSYEQLLNETKNAFEHKYGRYSQFKKKLNKEIKEEKKLIGSYKKFMNKYL